MMERCLLTSSRVREWPVQESLPRTGARGVDGISQGPEYAEPRIASRIHCMLLLFSSKSLRLLLSVIFPFLFVFLQIIHLMGPPNHLPVQKMVNFQSWSFACPRAWSCLGSMGGKAPPEWEGRWTPRSVGWIQRVLFWKRDWSWISIPLTFTSYSTVARH